MLLFFVLFCVLATVGAVSFVGTNLHFRRKLVKLENARTVRANNWMSN